MKNSPNPAVDIARYESDIRNLIETVRSQSEMIGRLVAERNERIHRETLAARRRSKVFRITARP